MVRNPDYTTACGILLDAVFPVETERISLSESGGRLLAQDLAAVENVPSFDRSPYDGYALRAADTVSASGEHPAVFRILEEIPAGEVSTVPVTWGTAVKILTGAPVPPGADAVIKFEETEFTKETVSLFSPLHSGENIIRAGEDVRKGDILARRGDVIDPGIAGSLASQGIAAPVVYRIPKVGIFSTGNELAAADETPGPGKIRNTNRYMLEAALKALGCHTIYLGTAEDSPTEISALIQKGLSTCDAIVSTGGVSVGDYDLTPEAMGMAGVTMLFQGVRMKPGMACAYGVRGGKPVCGLSGNPASALTNFYAVAVPALKKLMGCRQPMPKRVRMTLTNGFGKKSPTARFLRGKLELGSGTVELSLPQEQGNVVLSSAIGCDAMAIIPGGSGPIGAGTKLDGFLL